MDKNVDLYIEKQSSQQKEICLELRKTILKSLPGVKEEMKMGVPWYGGKCYIVALRDHVNIGFCLEGLSKEEASLLEGSGKMMRHIKIAFRKDIDEKKIVKLLKSLSR